MGFMKNMFANMEEEMGNLTASQKKKPQRRVSGPPPTRWEKAVVGLDKIVVQVVKVDPDGVDIVCFGGDEDADWYRNVKNTKNLEAMVTDKQPSGVSACDVLYCIFFFSRFSFVFLFMTRPSTTTTTDDLFSLSTLSLYLCFKLKFINTYIQHIPNKHKHNHQACKMGAALDEAINDAFDKDLTKCPCSILVLTAGEPDDSDDLEAALTKAVTRVADTCEKNPLSVTFVQIGNDPEATEYLEKLDGNITAECAANGETFDLVDIIKHDEIQAAMSEIKGTKSSGKNGALIGAFAGAAMGVGGMYIYNKQQAKKRTKGWGGKWQVTYDGEEIVVLNVKDDQAGNLVIDGFPGAEATTGAYSVPSEEENEDEEFEYTIEFKDPTGDWNVEGTVEDEHAITWSDGTRWDEMDQDGAKKMHYAAAAAGGAAAAGATGYLLDKKFFNKASKGDQCDYIILMDRSAKMNVVDPS